jgi:RHS repeat-associated protein
VTIRTRPVDCPEGTQGVYGRCTRRSPVIDPGKARGNPKTCVGNPCDPLSGNKFETETDYTGTGPFPLVFQRHYNSLGYNPLTEATGRVGGGWRASYLGWITAVTPDYAVVSPTTVQRGVVVHRPDGRSYHFAKVDGVWQSDSDVTDTLTEGANGWVYTTRDGTVEVYDNTLINGVGASKGKLLSVTNRAGLRHTVQHDEANGIVRVTDPFGRSLTLAFAGGKLSTLTDPAGQVTRYSYADANLVRVDYSDGTAKLYHYENGGHWLTGMSFVDRHGTITRYSTYSYNAGKAASTEHAGGMEKFTLSYTSGRTDVFDAVGTRESMVFSVSLGVPILTRKVNSADRKYIYLYYDTNNNLTCLHNELNQITTYAYNSANQRIRLTEGQSGYCSTPVATADTRTTTYEYLSEKLDLPTVIESPSVAGGTKTRKVSIGYDAQRNPVTITQTGYTPAGAAVSRSIALGYNAHGQVTSIDGPRTDVADVTTVSYYTCATGSACGQIQSVTNALGQTTTYDSYDADGRVLSITDPNGLRTMYTYDLRGRVATVAQNAPDGTSRLTRYGYDVAGNVTSVILPTGLALGYTYDAALKLRRVTDSLGNYIDYDYDLKGNRTRAYSYDPSGTLVRAVDLAYDARNRVSQLNTGGSITRQVWDAVGNLTRVTDPNTVAANGTAATAHTYDRLDRLIKTVDLLAGNTLYAYDVGDRLKQVTAPNNAVTAYAYDDLGNLLSETSPDRGTTTYTYDPAGNLKTATDARGITVSYGYDALNRVTSVDYPGTDEDIAYTYDSGAGCAYGTGRLCEVTDGSGTQRYGYDAFGNVLTHTRIELGTGYTTEYQYDAGNRVTGITYPGGRTATYGRDGLGRIGSVAATVAGAPTAILGNRVYRADGLYTSQTFGNGLTETRAQDLSGRLVSQFLGTADTRVYDYDLNGNLTRRQSLPDVADYGYDALDRLKADQGAAPRYFGYDKNGNRIHQAGANNSNAATLSYAAASNRLTQVGATPVVLDAAGHTTGYGAWTYTPNQAGQLARAYVSGALVGTYRYNHLRQRARKVQGTSSTLYHYDLQGKLLMETTGAGVLVRAYVWDDDAPVAQIDRDPATGQETLSYLHTDHLQTPRLATDANRQVVWRWEGEAFGGSPPSGSITVNLRFPGQYFDQETGLHYNWNRYYDPRVGRYITSDPIGLEGGLNTYSYVTNNPLRFRNWCWYGIGMYGRTGWSYSMRRPRRLRYRIIDLSLH